jgi:hypothetical protein
MGIEWRFLRVSFAISALQERFGGVEEWEWRAGVP